MEKIKYIIMSMLALVCCSAISVSCSSNDDEDASTYEGGETVFEDDEVPTSDQYGKTINKSIALWSDQDVKSIRSITIADNVISRFTLGMTVLPATLDATNIGRFDCVMLDNEDIVKIDADTALEAKLNEVRDRGAIFLLVQPSRNTINQFFNAINVPYPCLGEEDSDDHGEMLVYSYSPTLGKTYMMYHDSAADGYLFTDTIGTANKTIEEVESTEYEQGILADYIIEDIENIIESESATKGTRAESTSTAQKGSPIDINSIESVCHMEYNNYIQLDKSHYYNKKGGGINQYSYILNAWPIDQIKDKNGNVGPYYLYLTLDTYLAFGGCWQDMYKKDIKGLMSKVCEWAGSSYTWDFYCDPNSDYAQKVSLQENTDKTTEGSTTYTQGFSFSITGSGTVGASYDSEHKAGVSGSLGFSAGLTVSNSYSRTIQDVSYKSSARQDGKSHEGGKYTITEAKAYYKARCYGLVDVVLPPDAAISTLNTQAAWLYVIDKGLTDAPKFKLDTKVIVKSYQAYSDGSSGHMKTCGHVTEGKFYLDLTNYWFK